MTIAPRNFKALFLSVAVLLAAAAGPAQNSEEAIAFLRQLEEKNEGLTSLYGSFHQVRSNKMFLEEIESNGEFWYIKPDQFRCDYHEPSEARFYLVGDTGLYYTPELKQVERFQLQTGDSAPINQMLVGFGLSVERILDVFTVHLPEEQPSDEKLLTVDFVSKDVSRTMDYTRIRITFNREALEPRLLEMDEQEDSVTVRLKKIQPNAEIKEDLFKTDFPADVEIVEY